MKKNVKNILNFLFLFVFVLLIFTSIWTRKFFGAVTFDEILFHLMVPIEGTNTSTFTSFIVSALIPAIFVTILLFILLNYKFKYSINLSLNFRGKEFSFNIFPFNKITCIIIYIGIFIGSILFTAYKLDAVTFAYEYTNPSTFIEENYVDPRNVNIEFPEKKRNVIYLFLESMESSYSDVESGGIIETNLIPNLTRIANENINFSNTEKLGGTLSTNGATWTAGAMVTYHSGIPLKVDIGGNSYSGFESFLPGMYNFGDILFDNGYNSELLIGSNANFGGRRDLFTQHGNYKIFDWWYTVDNGFKKEEDYNNWWGFEDYELFEFAKEELIDLASREEPFNLTMLTVDTHFEDGFLSNKCYPKFGNHHKDVIYCNDGMINNFLQWVKEQDFYENTTIVIVGDHLTMDVDFFDEYDSNYTRTVYNTIINSAVETNNSKNRTFMTFDMFPTVLTAMGVKYDGDRLGLGTDLFSDSKTLAEEYGYEYVNDELKLKSIFYDNTFIYNKKD